MATNHPITPASTPETRLRRPAHRSTRALLAAALAGGAALLAPAAHGQGLIEVLATTEGTIPDGDATFGNFLTPVINQAGQVAFSTALNGGGTGIAVFRAGPGGMTLIARDQVILGSAFDINVGVPDLNDAGQVLFSRMVDPPFTAPARTELVRGDGVTTTVIAATGEDAPDGNGQFEIVTGSASLNAAGQAVFRGSLTNTALGANDDAGIFIGDGGALTQVARKGQPVPAAKSTELLFFNTIRLNDAGDVAFNGTTSSGFAAHTYNGSGLSTASLENQPIPGTDGVFNSVNSNLDLDGSGRIVVAGLLTQSAVGDQLALFRSDGTPQLLAAATDPDPDGSGALGNIEILNGISTNDAGDVAFMTNGGGDLFRLDDGGLTALVRQGDAAPDGNSSFSNISNPQINAAGQVVFEAKLAGIDVGTGDDDGLFLANGIDVLQVIRESQSVQGVGTVVNNGIDFIKPNDNRSLINDEGQIAFKVHTNSAEAIARFSIPDLGWTAAGSGTWDDESNWLYTTTPNSFHDATIAADTALTVQASTVRTTHAASLTLGGGAGVSTLRLAGVTAGDFRTLEASTILSNGVLELNDGRSFAAPELLNQGAIRGTGTIDAVLINEGQIEAIGNDLAFSQQVTNAAGTGLITGRNGTLRFDGGLDNDGAVAFTYDNIDIFGDITNDDLIIVTGNATATFFDDVQNNADINVAAGSSAVFFGGLSGNGIGGAGTVFLEGDIRPGFSPHQTDFGGDVVFGFLNKLEIELGGAIPGDEFDQLDIAGTATTGGALEVVLLDGFAPNLGDSFAFLTADEVLGSFSNVLLPELDGGLSFALAQDGSSVSLKVVPEPTSFALLAAGALGMIRRRPREAGRCRRA